jgi:hypothetical protein
MPFYRQAPYLSASSSTSGGGLLRFESLCRAVPSGSSTSGASRDHDSTDDYPEIGGSTYWNFVEEGHLIIMVAPAGAPSQNSSSRYFTIGRSEALDVRTPSDILVQNLNPDFNVVWLQTIMESIQHMTPEGSSLPALAQQGANATNHVIAVERSVSNHRRKPSIGNKSGGRAKCAQSEAASLASDNRRLADNDVRRRIMQNHSQ